MYRSISLSVLLWWQRISTELIDAFSMAQVSTICGLRGERIQTALWKPPHWKAGNYTLRMPTPDALDKFLNILQGQLCDFLFDFQCTKNLWKGGPFRIKICPKMPLQEANRRPPLTKADIWFWQNFAPCKCIQFPSGAPIRPISHD